MSCLLTFVEVPSTHRFLFSLPFSPPVIVPPTPPQSPCLIPLGQLLPGVGMLGAEVQGWPPVLPSQAAGSKRPVLLTLAPWCGDFIHEDCNKGQPLQQGKAKCRSRAKEQNEGVSGWKITKGAVKGLGEGCC